MKKVDQKRKYLLLLRRKFLIFYARSMSLPVGEFWYREGYCISS